MNVDARAVAEATIRWLDSNHLLDPEELVEEQLPRWVEEILRQVEADGKGS